ncbi:MAG: M20/M25/M40 family metallo-hydrolase [Candidatus Acidiferrales bacterium]
MIRSRRCSIFGFSGLFFLLAALSLCAQSDQPARAPGDIDNDLQQLVETPAVSGYEIELAHKIRDRLRGYAAETDNLGDVIVTIGSGVPHRLIVAPMDEPGFVVSGITHDGYLRVQRLPQNAILPLFEELYSARPVRIEITSAKWIDGVVAGLSVHLQPGRLHPPSAGDIEEMYVDIGASSAGEARRAGADTLSPLVMDRALAYMSGYRTAAAIGDRFGDAALIEMLRRLDQTKLKGTLTVAFVAQQWTGARGLQRVLSTTPADEVIYVGRLTPSGPIPGSPNLRKAPRRDPGSGVLIGLPETSESMSGFAAEIQKLAEANKIPITADYSGLLLPKSYLPLPSLPERTIHLGIATAWPSTPTEMIDGSDLSKLADLLGGYVQGVFGSASNAEHKGGGIAGSGASNIPPRVEQLLQGLVEVHGASGHEAAVRDTIKDQLPRWAKPETDDSGNLVLHLGSASLGAKTPRILVVAHMDEIGFEVKSIAKDGRLEVEWLGGGEDRYFAGHAALVHSSNTTHPAVMELPNSWDQPGFQWPAGPKSALRVDVGARAPEEVAQLGIQPGDWVTIPKKYRQLVGTRANGRSFDDRVGCAALVSAVWALGPNLKDRDVTLVWSTGEEIGLVGAAALAKRLAAEGRVPEYVFAVDTFVSSDSPLESKRFADAPIGKGFVIRAVDSSNIVPRDLVEKLIGLARRNQIPVQYGVTGGGNDGSAFVRYGSVDIALGWPLRYSHSPGELIDTRDVEALAHIIAVIARSW